PALRAELRNEIVPLGGVIPRAVVLEERVRTEFQSAVRTVDRALVDESAATQISRSLEIPGGAVGDRRRAGCGHGAAAARLAPGAGEGVRAVERSTPERDVVGMNVTVQV